jgi:hypothetical protein
MSLYVFSDVEKFDYTHPSAIFHCSIDNRPK